MSKLTIAVCDLTVKAEEAAINGVADSHSHAPHINKGALAILSDFGPRAENNQEPLSCKVVLVLADSIHSVNIVDRNKLGHVSLSKTGVAVIDRKLSYEDMPSFFNNESFFKMELSHVTPFDILAKKAVAA